MGAYSSRSRSFSARFLAAPGSGQGSGSALASASCARALPAVGCIP